MRQELVVGKQSRLVLRWAPQPIPVCGLCQTSGSPRTANANSVGYLQEVVLSEQSRAREEAEKRLNKLMKNLDHLERARREEEAPLLEANHTKQASQGLSSASGFRGLGCQD